MLLFRIIQNILAKNSVMHLLRSLLWLIIPIIISWNYFIFLIITA